MAKKAKRPPPPRNDEELKERLREVAPEVLKANATDDWFGKIVGHLLQKSPDSHENPHFYCRRCGGYHLKTHPHYQPR